MKKELRHLLLPDVACAYGAPLTRRSFGEVAVGSRVRDVAIPLTRGGYDPGGAYWGVGAPLRCRFQIDERGELVMRRFYRKGDAT